MLGACQLTSLATSMLYELAARDDGVPEDDCVRPSLLPPAHSVCQVADSQVEPEGGENSVPCVTLVSVRCGVLTAVSIAYLLYPRGQAPAVAAGRRLRQASHLLSTDYKTITS